jgi:uncharacterized membrane protein YhfC
MKRLAVFIVMLSLALPLAGCAETAAQDQSKSSYITGAELNESAPGNRTFFDVKVEQPGDPVTVSFRGTLLSGSARAILIDADGRPVWQKAVEATNGLFAVDEVLRGLPAGDYRLGVAWDGPVKASFNLYYWPGEVAIPELSPVVLLGGVGMVLVALGYVVFALARKLNLKYVGLGALGWVGAVVLKFAWAIPVNGPMLAFLDRSLPEDVARFTFYIYVGFLTGFFEVILVYLALRFTRSGRETASTWQGALAFGVGFGALEAFLLGLLSLVGTLPAVVMPQLYPLPSLQDIARANDVVWAVAPIWERFFTVLIHIVSNVLICYAIARRQVGWMWLAVAYKTLLDAVAAFGQVNGINTPAMLWGIEAVIGVMGTLGWLGTRWLIARYPHAEAEEQPTASAPLPPAARALPPS